MANVVELKTIRKIKQIEETVKVKQQILRIKEEYLNKLSKFEQYDSIRKECYQLYDETMKLSFNIGMYEQTLERLRKEVE